jgi:hypothetical protein
VFRDIETREADMKKTVFSKRKIVNAAVSCIVIFTILGCGACSAEEAQITVSADKTTYAKGTEKVNFVVVNDSSATIEMGEKYTVEKRGERNDWIKTSLTYGWDDIAWTIVPGDRHEFKVYLSDTADEYDYQPGEYRIRKEYTIDGESKDIYYNFTIVE